MSHDVSSPRCAVRSAAAPDERTADEEWSRDHAAIEQAVSIWLLHLVADRAAVMAEVGRVIERDYELGALGDGSGIPGFYQRLGWETWQGPTWVAAPQGRERTAEEDGSILVLRTPATGELELTASITCDWRPGDVW